MRKLHRLVAVAALGGLIVAAPSRGQEPKAGKSAPLARYFPAEDLVAYGEFDGLDAHSEAWKKSSTYRLLNETSTGALLEATLTELLEKLLDSVPPDEKKPTTAEITAVVDHLMRSGFAFGINRKAGEAKPYLVGLVLRGAAKGEARAPIARLIDAANFAPMKAESATKPGDRKVIVVSDPSGSGFSWWSEGDDLAFSIVMPKGADAMIDALDGRRPNALENPGRRELAGRVDGFEPIGLGYFDMAALPQLPPQAASLGLDKIKRLDYRWGFQGEALVTVTRLVAPSPRVGIMAMFDGPTFSTKDLPPMPAGVQGFTAFSFDADAFLAKALALATAAEPKAREGFDQAMQMFRQGTGKRLREDVLQQLGPRAISFTVPTRGNLPTNPLIGFAQGVVQVPKTTFMVEVRDPKAFGETLDSLIVKANSAIGQALAGANGGEAPKGVGFVPLKGATKGYSIQMPMGILPLPAGMRPTLILGKKYLILGTTPDVAKRALALENAPPGPIAGPMGEALARAPGR